MGSSHRRTALFVATGVVLSLVPTWVAGGFDLFMAVFVVLTILPFVVLAAHAPVLPAGLVWGVYAVLAGGGAVLLAASATSDSSTAGIGLLWLPGVGILAAIGITILGVVAGIRRRPV